MTKKKNINFDKQAQNNEHELNVQKQKNDYLLARFKEKNFADRVTLGLNIGLRGIIYLGLAFFGYLSIAEATNLHLVIEVLGVKNLSSIIAWSLVLIFYLWAQGEKKLRKKAITELSEANGKLEKIIDENRTSSQLTKTGETPKGDVK